MRLKVDGPEMDPRAQQAVKVQRPEPPEEDPPRAGVKPPGFVGQMHLWLAVKHRVSVEKKARAPIRQMVKEREEG